MLKFKGVINSFTLNVIVSYLSLFYFSPPSFKEFFTFGIMFFFSITIISWLGEPHLRMVELSPTITLCEGCDIFFYVLGSLDSLSFEAIRDLRLTVFSLASL